MPLLGPIRYPDTTATVNTCTLWRKHNTSLFSHHPRRFNNLLRRQCFCGFATDDTDALGLANCDKPCSGDAGEMCGGTNAISVHQLDGTALPAPTPPVVGPPPYPPGPEPTPAPVGSTPGGSDYTQLGCYTDTHQARVLSGSFIKNFPNMSAAVRISWKLPVICDVR